MHERSLVQSVLDQVEAEQRSRQLGRVLEVRLAVGEFSGVEPVLLELAFAEMSAERWQRTMRLRVEVVPLTARCRRCTRDFPVERFRFVCSHCGCGEVDVVAGEEMRLVSLVTELALTPESTMP